MAEPIPPTAAGTPQHRGARDLSRWLVHLTRTPEDLAKILTQGQLQARNPFGIAKSYQSSLKNQNSICFTEIPLTELHRMTKQGRHWGIVFDKEKLRERFGAQPVWYLSDPSPQWDAAKEVLSNHLTPTGQVHDPSEPYWKMTPFIDPVRPTVSPRPHDWRWEREWRVLENLDFELSDVAFIVWPEGDAFLWEKEVTVGSLFVSHDGDEFWSGSPIEAIDLKLSEMLDEISQQFITVDNAGLPWDSEEKQFVQLIEIIDAHEVVYESFEALPEAVTDALAEALMRRGGDMWCRIADYENAHE